MASLMAAVMELLKVLGMEIQMVSVMDGLSVR